MTSDSWLYSDLKNRVCIELDEFSFLPEVDGFFFDASLVTAHLGEVNLDTLKFSKVIDGMEEVYSFKKDKNIISGLPVYYPDDNCFFMYYSLVAPGR